MLQRHALLESKGVLTIRARFAHRFRYLRLLRVSLGLGAAYNLGVALLVALASDATARRLGLAADAARALPAVLAVAFTMLAALFLTAAHDPRRYSAVIAVAIGGRLAGAAVLAGLAATHPHLAILYPAAGAELGLGLAHATLWYPVYS